LETGRFLWKRDASYGLGASCRQIYQAAGLAVESGRFLWTGGILPPDLPSWKLGCGSETLPLHTTCSQLKKLI